MPQFEEDVFGGVNLFAGARLDTSIDRAVEKFNRQLDAGIAAAARAPQQGGEFSSCRNNEARHSALEADDGTTGLLRNALAASRTPAI